jgi:hypothetical protein
MNGKCQMEDASSFDDAYSRKHQRGVESTFGIMWIFEGYGVKSLMQSKYFFCILTISSLPTFDPSLVGLKSNLVLLLYMAFYFVAKGCNPSHTLGMGSFFNFVIILFVVKQDDPDLDEMGS